MKALKITNDVHKSLKIAAAKKGRQVSDMGTSLLACALDLLEQDRIKCEENSKKPLEIATKLN